MASAVSHRANIANAETDRAAAEADPAAFFKQRALGPNNLVAPSRGPLENAGMAMQSTLLDAPQSLQGKQLRLGKKVTSVFLEEATVIWPMVIGCSLTASSLAKTVILLVTV